MRLNPTALTSKQASKGLKLDHVQHNSLNGHAGTKPQKPAKIANPCHHPSIHPSVRPSVRLSVLVACHLGRQRTDLPAVGSPSSCGPPGWRGLRRTRERAWRVSLSLARVAELQLFTLNIATISHFTHQLVVCHACVSHVFVLHPPPLNMPSCKNLGTGRPWSRRSSEARRRRPGSCAPNPPPPAKCLLGKGEAQASQVCLARKNRVRSSEEILGSRLTFLKSYKPRQVGGTSTNAGDRHARTASSTRTAFRGHEGGSHTQPEHSCRMHRHVLKSCHEKWRCLWRLEGTPSAEPLRRCVSAPEDAWRSPDKSN